MSEGINMKPLALIVDDEEKIRETLAGILEDEGWEVLLASNGYEGIDVFKKSDPDLVFLDVWMPNLDGIQTLQILKELDLHTPVVIMSGHGTIETAVKATKIGAFEYLEKPLSLDKIIPLLDHAAKIKSAQDKSSLLGDATEMIGSSDTVLQIKRQINMVAPRNAWVLITGENGTGKEVAARNIHARSSRASNSFVAVNCAAIPEELIESELFGHQKGAFTNAIASKQGKFELAHQGTLFLDEIGDMSLKTQAKILRILQEQKFERVGGVEAISVDVRVVAATNKNLPDEIEKGSFREDLFYRLNVVPFELPPLRDRGDDVRDLCTHFFQQFSLELGEPEKRLSDEAYNVLLSYRWPGNIRELKNILERICVMIPDSVISIEHLRGLIPIVESSRPTSTLGVSATTLKQAKTDFERAFILDKLEKNQWNVTKTAEAIGVERSNLHRKLKFFNIDPKQRG